MSTFTSSGSSIAGKACSVATAVALTEVTKSIDTTELILIAVGVVGTAWIIGAGIEYYTLKRCGVSNNIFATWIQNKFNNPILSTAVGFGSNRVFDLVDWGTVVAALSSGDPLRGFLSNMISKNVFGLPISAVANGMHLAASRPGI